VVERALAFIRAGLAASPAYGRHDRRGQGGGEILPFALDRSC
jgi:hypothetical protein